MSTYADNVRQEIFSSKPLKGKYRKAFSYGILLFGKRFDEEIISFSTEHITASKLYGFAINDIVKRRPAFSMHVTPKGNSIYSCCLSDKPSIESLLISLGHVDDVINEEFLNEESFPAFLAGVFMACGSVSDPKKTYHLEFLPPNDEKSDLLFYYLSQMGYPPKSSVRRGQTVLYYKESSQIEDILTMIGAVKSSLMLMEAKIYKDLRNRANRSTNCETANIDKIVKAATSQREDIEFLISSGEFSNLTEVLKETANLRLQNPEASLSEMAEISGVSRSGINHRFNKLSKIVKKLKSEMA